MACAEQQPARRMGHTVNACAGVTQTAPGAAHNRLLCLAHMPLLCAHSLVTCCWKYRRDQASQPAALTLFAASFLDASQSLVSVPMLMSRLLLMATNSSTYSNSSSSWYSGCTWYRCYSHCRARHMQCASLIKAGCQAAQAQQQATHLIKGMRHCWAAACCQQCVCHYVPAEWGVVSQMP